MEHILMREAVPLSPSHWELIDKTVKEVASQILVGRKILQLYGPLGFGVYTVPLYSYKLAEGEPIKAELSKHLPLVMICRDFAITSRDLDAFERGQPFDIGPIAAAAALCAAEEDELIFKGCEETGLEGLLNASGRQILPLGDWEKEGQALTDISKAVAKLTSSGFYGPYAVIMNPAAYALLQRVVGRQGLLEVELVKKVAEAGLFFTPAVPEDRVVVLSPKPVYMDLAIGQDMVTAYLESSNMEHKFRVFETVALRIKQPGAICTLEK
jgi:uncharacterized linocin/CFP29 family protein